MGVFYAFKIVQMVPNRAKQDIYSRKKARFCYKTEQKRKTEEKMKEAIREEITLLKTFSFYFTLNMIKDADGIVQVSLLLALNIFHTLVLCFYC